MDDTTVVEQLKEIKQIQDGSVVCPFDHVSPMQNENDIGCSSFIEFKPAFGCFFNCQYPCYLSPYRNTPAWNTVKDKDKVLKHLRKALFGLKTPTIFNMGEQEDSLLLLRLGERKLFNDIIDLFQNRSINIAEHKLLLLTKDYDDMMWIRPDYSNVIMSASINTPTIINTVELGSAILDFRLLGLDRATQHGMETRIRLDPLFNNMDYGPTINEIKDFGIKPTVITIGSLRLKRWGYQKARSNKSFWAKEMTEKTKWGNRYPFKTRLNIYKKVISQITTTFPNAHIALCKEEKRMWKAVKLDPTKTICNCVLTPVDMTV